MDIKETTYSTNSSNLNLKGQVERAARTGDLQTIKTLVLDTENFSLLKVTDDRKNLLDWALDNTETTTMIPIIDCIVTHNLWKHFDDETNELHIAALQKSFNDIFLNFVDKKPELAKQRTRTGRTPAFYAAAMGQEEDVQKLLYTNGIDKTEQGAKPSMATLQATAMYYFGQYIANTRNFQQNKATFNHQDAQLYISNFNLYQNCFKRALEIFDNIPKDKITADDQQHQVFCIRGLANSYIQLASRHYHLYFSHSFDDTQRAQAIKDMIQLYQAAIITLKQKSPTASCDEENLGLWEIQLFALQQKQLPSNNDNNATPQATNESLQASPIVAPQSAFYRVMITTSDEIISTTYLSPQQTCQQ